MGERQDDRAFEDIAGLIREDKQRALERFRKGDFDRRSGPGSRRSLSGSAGRSSGACWSRSRSSCSSWSPRGPCFSSPDGERRPPWAGRAG